MKRTDAEHLLGGYAAGILSEAERKLLFEAALEDQALFDALADEEALRELLADPAARSQLLAALTKVPKVLPFWRRPMVLGAAASLLVAVGGTLLVQRSEQAAYRSLEMKAPAAAETPKENALKSTAPKTEPPAAAHQDKLDGIAAPLRAVPQNQPTQGQATASGAGGRQRSAEATADLAPGVAVAPEAQAKARAARPDAKDLEAKPSELNMGGPPPAAAPAQPAPAPAGAFARTPAAETRAKKEARQDAGDATHGVNLGGVAGGDISRSGAGQSSDVFGRSLIPPTWKVTATGPDRYQVKATWGPGGQLYLLKRHEDRAEVLIPIREITYKDRTATWYDLTVTGTDVLDLYLLPTAPKDPTSLPAEGPVQGFRARVWPEQKKSP